MRYRATSQTKISRASNPVRGPEKDTLEHFEKFCSLLHLPDTLQPFILEDWQRDALRDYFEHGAMEHLWEWPTGMGKSTLLGALALHHGTFVRINPKVIIVGGMGGHAKHTLRAAAWFVSQNKSLARWWVAQEYGMGRIKSLIPEDAFGVIEVSSAGRRVGRRGGSSQEGEAPSLVLVEELHRHEDDGAAVRTLTTKVQKRTVGAHKVRIVHVTTAGDTLDSPLGRMEGRATGPESRIISQTDYYTHAEDPDGDLVMHRWAVPETIRVPEPNVSQAELDVFLDHVKCANPATFITKPNLRRSFRASASEPWVFARQHCNQWITQHQAAFSVYDWNECLHDGLMIPVMATPVYVGLDTGRTFAATGIVPVWRNQDGMLVTSGTVVLKSHQEGSRARMRDVIGVIESMRERWPLLQLVFDRNAGGGLIAEQFEEDHGMVCIDHGQGVPMEHASMLLGELISQHALRHDGSQALTTHVLAAVAKPTSYRTKWRIDSPRTGDNIDACVALAMAIHVAHQTQTINPDDFRIRPLEDW